MKKKLIAILLKHFNLAGLFNDMLDEVLEPALQKVVDDTKTPFDNIAMASVYPVLEAEIKKSVNEKIAELLKDDVA